MDFSITASSNVYFQIFEDVAIIADQQSLLTLMTAVAFSLLLQLPEHEEMSSAEVSNLSI